jgi:hypothetical protein
MQKISIAAVCVLGLVASQATVQANENFDFATANGGFTVQNAGGPENPWVYGAYSVTPGGGNSWYANGSSDLGAPSVSYLYSPYLRVQASGTVSGSFLHRFNFEYDAATQTAPEERWDAGQVQYRVNEGAWQPVSLLFGQTYNGTVTGNNVLNDQQAFTDSSSGYSIPYYVQTGFELGSGTATVFNANDLIELRFVAAWDEYTKDPAPNWQLGNMLLNNLSVQPIPEPTVGAFAALGGLCLFFLRRRN